jgi:hypothetical protein
MAGKIERGKGARTQVETKKSGKGVLVVVSISQPSMGGRQEASLRRNRVSIRPPVRAWRLVGDTNSEDPARIGNGAPEQRAVMAEEGGGEADGCAGGAPTLEFGVSVA